jgi:protein gp37
MTEARRRIPILLATPAARRFLSCEPLLERIDITLWLPKLDWIICGGETGAGARLMNENWARILKFQCQAFRTPFFLKQMTRKAPIPGDLLVREFPASAM